MVRARASVLAISLIASEAAGAPSLWDRVAEPHTVAVQEALTKALRAREPRELSPEALSSLPAFEALLALRAVAILEQAGGEALDDPEVWYYLGDSLIVANRGREEEGRALLRRALAAAPDSPEAAHAWFQIGIASDRLRQFEDERAAYTEALRVQWDGNHRAQIYLNRGEASMSRGLLLAARADYEASLALASEPEIRALAAWGLAVALAREEDLPGSLPRAWEATQFKFRDAQGNFVNALELPSVFFTPDYEIYFYRALGAMAASEHREKPEEKKTELEYAISQWQRYLAEARPAGDRWKANAEFHLLWCKRRLGKR
jgi:tetratricopeptide (TPR) repeat protein